MWLFSKELGQLEQLGQLGQLGRPTRTPYDLVWLFYKLGSKDTQGHSVHKYDLRFVWLATQGQKATQGPFVPKKSHTNPSRRNGRTDGRTLRHGNSLRSKLKRMHNDIICIGLYGPVLFLCAI